MRGIRPSCIVQYATMRPSREHQTATKQPRGSHAGRGEQTECEQLDLVSDTMAWRVEEFKELEN